LLGHAQIYVLIKPIIFFINLETVNQTLMCGISGFIDCNKKSSLEILKSITDILHHRGPDDSGYQFLESDLIAAMFTGPAAILIQVPRSDGTLRPIAPQHATVPLDLIATLLFPPAAI
jgi:hypothetical protein